MLIELEYEWVQHGRRPELVSWSPEGGGAIVLTAWLGGDIQFLPHVIDRLVSWLKAPGDDLSGGGNTCDVILSDGKVLLEAQEVIDDEGNRALLTSIPRLIKLLEDTATVIAGQRVGERFRLALDVDAEGHEAKNQFWQTSASA